MKPRTFLCFLTVAVLACGPGEVRSVEDAQKAVLGVWTGEAVIFRPWYTRGDQYVEGPILYHRPIRVELMADGRAKWVPTSTSYVRGTVLHRDWQVLMGKAPSGATVFGVTIPIFDDNPLIEPYVLVNDTLMIGDNGGILVKKDNPPSAYRIEKLKQAVASCVRRNAVHLKWSDSTCVEF